MHEGKFTLKIVYTKEIYDQKKYMSKRNVRVKEAHKQTGEEGEYLNGGNLISLSSCNGIQYFIGAMKNLTFISFDYYKK